MVINVFRPELVVVFGNGNNPQNEITDQEKNDWKNKQDSVT